jgi:hypothetical protein
VSSETNKERREYLGDLVRERDIFLSLYFRIDLSAPISRGVDGVDSGGVAIVVEEEEGKSPWPTTSPPGPDQQVVPDIQDPLFQRPISHTFDVSPYHLSSLRLPDSLASHSIQN